MSTDPPDDRPEDTTGSQPPRKALIRPEDLDDPELVAEFIRAVLDED